MLYIHGGEQVDSFKYCTTFCDWLIPHPEDLVCILGSDHIIKNISYLGKNTYYVEATEFIPPYPKFYRVFEFIELVPKRNIDDTIRKI